MQQRTEYKAALCRLFTTKVRIMGPQSWYYFFTNRRNQRRLTVRSQLKVPLFIVYVQVKILTFYWTYDTMLKKHSGRRLNVCRSRGAYLCLSIFQSTSGQVRPDDTAIIVAKLFPFCKRKMLRQKRGPHHEGQKDRHCASFHVANSLSYIGLPFSVGRRPHVSQPITSCSFSSSSSWLCSTRIWTLAVRPAMVERYSLCRHRGLHFSGATRASRDSA